MLKIDPDAIWYFWPRNMTFLPEPDIVVTSDRSTFFEKNFLRFNSIRAKKLKNIDIFEIGRAVPEISEKWPFFSFWAEPLGNFINPKCGNDLSRDSESIPFSTF